MVDRVFGNETAAENFGKSYTLQIEFFCPVDEYLLLKRKKTFRMYKKTIRYILRLVIKYYYIAMLTVLLIIHMS